MMGLNRARPTNGSGRGSLRDHDLTLCVRNHLPLPLGFCDETDAAGAGALTAGAIVLAMG